jgi:alpha-aminoadipic semialdehyde synthase
MLSKRFNRSLLNLARSRTDIYTRSISYVGNKVLGIVRENHGMWERRAPLSPDQVNKLLTTLPGSKVLIQPCTRRIFTNEEYTKAGAVVSEDLTSANFILGVKSIKAEELIPNKSYMFFSHTIKAQPYSMPMLDTILEKKVRLFDYECITKDGRDDTPRLVAFGNYAGRAGMVDGLQGLGIRLLAEGYSTPFLYMPNTYMHRSLEEVKSRLKIVGEMISTKGFPSALSPMVFSFTGNGNVAIGAREIFECLPHEYISAADLPSLKDDIAKGKRKSNILYGIKLKTSDLVSHKTNSSSKFSKEDYYHHPENYEPIFHKTVLPYTTMLVNGIYWEPRFPRLITKEQLKTMRSEGNKNLRAVADISCDIEGSVEFLSRPTSIENPFYMFNPEKNDITANVTSNGVLMLGVDNLPTELPADASRHFGERLLPLLPPLLTATDSNYESLPSELKRACIANDGHLTPKWKYITRLREQTRVLRNASTTAIPPSSYLKLELIVRSLFPLVFSFIFSFIVFCFII